MKIYMCVFVSIFAYECMFMTRVVSTSVGSNYKGFTQYHIIPVTVVFLKYLHTCMYICCISSYVEIIEENTNFDSMIQWCYIFVRENQAFTSNKLQTTVPNSCSLLLLPLFISSYQKKRFLILLPNSEFLASVCLHFSIFRTLANRHFITLIRSHPCRTECTNNNSTRYVSSRELFDLNEILYLSWKNLFYF